jgi:hypothetical protein
MTTLADTQRMGSILPHTASDADTTELRLDVSSRPTARHQGSPPPLPDEATAIASAMNISRKLPRRKRGVVPWSCTSAGRAYGLASRGRRFSKRRQRVNRAIVYGEGRVRGSGGCPATTTLKPAGQGWAEYRKSRGENCGLSQAWGPADRAPPGPWKAFGGCGQSGKQIGSA